MKKGLSDAVFVPSWDTKTFLTAASQAGFEGVELNVREDIGDLRFDSSRAKVRAVAAQAEDLDLEIASVTTGLLNQYALSSGEKSLRTKGIEIVGRMIEFAAHMNAKVVQVVPGTVTPDVPYEVAYGLAQESLKDLANLAAAAGVVLGIENVCNQFLPSPLEFSRFLTELNHPSIQAYFDNGNAMVTGHAEHFVYLLGSRIVSMHAKGFRRTVGDFVSIFEGDVNWPVLTQLLREIPFTGYIISTPPYPYAHRLERLLDTASRDMDALLDM